MARLEAKRKQQTQSAGSETTKLIRKTRQATRKRYTAEEKIRIVMEGVRGEEPVSAICRREGIHSNMYYRWLKRFRTQGGAGLQSRPRPAVPGPQQKLRAVFLPQTVHHSPRALGMAQERWTLQALQHLCVRPTGQRPSLESIRRALNRIEDTWRVGKAKAGTNTWRDSLAQLTADYQATLTAMNAHILSPTP